MKKLLTLVLSLSILSSCVSVDPSTQQSSGIKAKPVVNPAQTGELWSMASSNGRLLFYGMSGRRSKQEEAIQLALEDAARKVAMFYSVEGSIVQQSTMGSATFDYSSSTNTTLLYDKDYKRYVDMLEYDPETDVFEYQQMVIVRAWYRTSSFVPSYESSWRDGRPTWTLEPPTIPGFLVGVGYAGRRSVHKDTVNASHENALFAIISNRSNTVQNNSTSYRGPGTFDYGSRTNSTITSSGRLEGFYVLATWEDTRDKSLWSLGIARQ
ncbi:MAG: hypothetical protein LBJ41_07750 [Treponema sp.]|jgi:hypothetical protein|nr:hypothetical protein [Treponema sp.]